MTTTKVGRDKNGHVWSHSDGELRTYVPAGKPTTWASLRAAYARGAERRKTAEHASLFQTLRSYGSKKR
jgi:hypothetical protein